MVILAPDTQGPGIAANIQLLPASTLLLAEPSPPSMIFCYLCSSGPAILACTKQLPRETIIPKNQGSICSATGKWSHSCCILPHVTAVRPTWAWIRMSEYVLRKKQTNLDYLTKVFPLGTWPLQTVPDKSWFTALANDKSKQRKWCRITECTQILPCMQSNKMTELWSSAHRRGGWQYQVNAKPMKDKQSGQGALVEARTLIVLPWIWTFTLAAFD